MEAAGIEPAFSSDASTDGITDCVICPDCGAANALHSGSTPCQQSSPIDTDLLRVTSSWESLPQHVRQTILSLVDAVSGEAK